MTIFFLTRVVISYAAHHFISTCTVTSGEDLVCFAKSGISDELYSHVDLSTHKALIL